MRTKIQLFCITNVRFDIHGLLAPVVFFPKLLFQMVCIDDTSLNNVSQRVKKRCLENSMFCGSKMLHEQIDKGKVNVMLLESSDRLMK